MRQERPADYTFWHATRRPAESSTRTGDRGTEVYLSLVDLGFRPSAPADWTLEVETTCLNRDLPQGLPFGGDQPRLQFRAGGGVISGIVCLTAPTRTLRPALRQGLLWRLISHLALNHLSLVGDGQADALREILKLYDFADSAETRNQINGIVRLDSRRIVGSVRTDGMVAFCRGLEVTLQFDEERFSAERPVPVRQRAGTVPGTVLHRQFVLQARRHRQGAPRGAASMATEDGRESTGLNHELLQAPYRFDFFQAVRLLQHRQREQARARRRPALSVDLWATTTRVTRLYISACSPRSASPQAPSANFERSLPVQAATTRPPPPEMVVTFFGLTGPSGVLPRHYTELLIQRIRDRDYSLRDFLDLFHHRLISLFYRAWEKYRLPINYERSQLDEPLGELEPITLGLYCLVGMGTPGLRGRLEISDESFLHYSGHFAHFPRSALALECLLRRLL